ncbi:hypothetical protein IMZ48_43420 [Candidatus Bathyarchaeota archaeon]|nr:hypothetical protein [Candidatus Bathyarchaeota archaeon]
MHLVTAPMQSKSTTPTLSVLPKLSHSHHPSTDGSNARSTSLDNATNDRRAVPSRAGALKRSESTSGESITNTTVDCGGGGSYIRDTFSDVWGLGACLESLTRYDAIAEPGNT